MALKVTPRGFRVSGRSCLRMLEGPSVFWPEFGKHVARSPGSAGVVGANPPLRVQGSVQGFPGITWDPFSLCPVPC